MRRETTRTILIWALGLALGAFALKWLQAQYLARRFSFEIYVSIVGVVFAAGGVWAGWRLTRRAAPQPFAHNAAARASLGLTGQEMKVLERLAAGQSNKEIAQSLAISEATVKVHLAAIMRTLKVHNRTQVVLAAKQHNLLG